MNLKMGEDWRNSKSRKKETVSNDFDLKDFTHSEAYKNISSEEDFTADYLKELQKRNY